MKEEKRKEERKDSVLTGVIIFKDNHKDKIETFTFTGDNQYSEILKKFFQSIGNYENDLRKNISFKLRDFWASSSNDEIVQLCENFQLSSFLSGPKKLNKQQKTKRKSSSIKPK